MKACSPGAITATISRLVPETLELRIKRKTKQLANNKTIWWFVVHGTERDLVVLEQGWKKVQIQIPVVTMQFTLFIVDPKPGNIQSESKTFGTTCKSLHVNSSLNIFLFQCEKFVA